MVICRLGKRYRPLSSGIASTLLSDLVEVIKPRRRDQRLRLVSTGSRSLNDLPDAERSATNSDDRRA